MKPRTKATLESDVWFETAKPRDTLNVLCDDEAPQPTGLLDAQGRKLFRVSEKRPIGFTAKWRAE